MADGVHQVGLAHAHAAIEEQGVIGLRGPLGHGQRGGAGKLVAVADHEGVKGVTRVELRCRGPVEARLLGRAQGRGRSRGGMGGNRPEAAIGALRRNRGILLGGDETDLVQFQIQLLDGLLNQVTVLVAKVLKLRRGDAHV